MSSRRSLPVVSVTLGLIVALSLATSAGIAGQGGPHPPDNVVVNFGNPNNLAGVAANHIVVPDEAEVRKGGTVTFIVNGPGHGIAIYPVSKDTTRDDITTQLCVHNQATGACGNPTFANGDHTIVDGKGNTVIVTGTNPPITRVDDTTDRLLGTSTQTGVVPGPFLAGTLSDGTIGTRLQYRFEKSGRYLIVCMNRGHYLNNWMFGFVTVN